MAETTPTVPQEDTISLIDLLVVVVRFRHWILGLTLAGLLGSLGFLGFKSFVAQESLVPEPIYKAQMTMVISDSPALLSDYLDRGIAGQALAALQTLDLVVPVFKASVVDGNSAFTNQGFDKMGTLEFYLQDNVIGKSLVAAQDAWTVKVSFEGHDATRAKEFVTALTERVRLTIRAQVLQQISAARKSLSQALVSMEAGTGSTQDRVLVAAELRQKVQLLDLLASDEAFPLVPLGGVAVLALPPGKGTTDSKALSPTLLVVLVTVASMFVSVVIAFVLEYLRRLRSTPSEMDKLRQALINDDRR